MSIITFPKILNDRLTDEGARALADILDRLENSSQKVTLEIAEERFEKRVSNVEISLNAKIEGVATQLDAKIDRVAAESKAELIKWMFIFWIGQAVTMFGMFQTFLSKH